MSPLRAAIKAAGRSFGAGIASLKGSPRCVQNVFDSIIFKVIKVYFVC